MLKSLWSALVPGCLPAWGDTKKQGTNDLQVWCAGFCFCNSKKMAVLLFLNCSRGKLWMSYEPKTSMEGICSHSVLSTCLFPGPPNPLWVPVLLVTSSKIFSCFIEKEKGRLYIQGWRLVWAFGTSGEIQGSWGDIKHPWNIFLWISNVVVVLCSFSITFFPLPAVCFFFHTLSDRPWCLCLSLEIDTCVLSLLDNHIPKGR